MTPPRRAFTAIGLALLTLANLAACRKPPAPNPLPIASPALVTEPAKTEAVLPWPTGQSDEVTQEWIRELTRKRLSALPGLNWQCLSSIEGVWVQAPVSCDALVRASASNENAPAVPLELSCEGQRLRIAKTPCTSGATSYPPAFDHIWLPEGSSLYRHLPSSQLEPIQDAALPSLRFEDPTRSPRSPAWFVPSGRAWLKQGGTTGAYAIVLTLENDDAEGWWALWRLIESSAEAADLPLFLDRTHVQALGRLSPEPKETRSSPPFLWVQTPQSGLYEESCGYVANWLHARQLVRGQNPRAAKPRNVVCRIRWAPSPLSPRPVVPARPALILSRLPFPFVSPTGTFPLRTLEEGLSPALLRSLAR